MKRDQQHLIRFQVQHKLHLGKDPFKQIAIQNDLKQGFGHSNNHKDIGPPNLKNYAFNTKKTALDPKRNYSELMRMVSAPFGEEKENDLEEFYEKKTTQLKKFAEELETIESLKPKSKKILSD